MTSDPILPLRGLEARGRIVLIEDDPDISMAASYALERAGYRLIAARTGNEGFDAVCRGASLVILDLNLPDEDGIEVCRRIRARPSSKDTPILMASARDEDEDIARGIEAGANDYLIKPYSLRDLVLRCGINIRRHAGILEVSPSR